MSSVGHGAPTTPAGSRRCRTLVTLLQHPDHARDLAAWAAGHGADYFDGAMMALPETVATWSSSVRR
ncbi:hypothetical protein [Nocardia sp. NPDC058633]|uniref:hypothetical protein n=1 Tax=Nocardia sp. NPDC058633 TaxID=3346568 RepID=UPI003660B060